ncbi:NAD glycohydrolase toxin immunity factor [Streptococcus zhangguiae]|uniref:Uncharacterized protein n=1 Tax=Streptococcus zhangguiae TaxID=2664091 RepID=A0A6I4RDN6_9STRE|nr:NAD glycohydrolase toxin immunity factor [Streptococcus sp. zg-70]MWV55920.1 hypothetical protein [Streptococcus sp. zg-70]
MSIKIFNNDIDSRRRELYMKARSENSLSKVFLGIDNYIIHSRDSYFQEITDIVVLIERCLYPLFLMGDKSIPDEVKNILITFSKSNRLVELYQVVSFINYQKESPLFPKEFAFSIDFQSMLPDIVEGINNIDIMTLTTDFEKKLYTFIQNMLRTTPIIRNYLNENN